MVICSVRIGASRLSPSRSPSAFVQVARTDQQATMSSKWLWFLSFSIVICCQTANGAWETNEDVMDLTIAICQKPSNYDKGPPDRLIQMLSETVRKLKISENKTRLTIYEIGGPNQIHRLIDNSFDKDDIIKAINDIGNHFKSGQDTTYNEAAKGIRDLVDAKATDRIDVPKPVVIIWESEPNSANESTLKDAADSNGAGFVSLSKFRDSGDVHVIIVFPAIHEPYVPIRGPVKERNVINVVSSNIARTIRDRVQNCEFQQSTSTCYTDTGGQCVEDILYKTMYTDGADVEEPPSKKLEKYCYKNGSSIPCSPDDCPTTTTTTTSTTTRPTTKITTTKKNGNATNVAHKKPDETDSSMTRLMIGVGITCFFVIVAVIALAVFLVCRRKKRAALHEKKTEEARKKIAPPKKKPQFKVAKTNPHCKVVKIKSKSAAAEKNSKVPQSETPPGDPEYSVSEPPSVSATPLEEIAKQMLKESKAKK